MKTLSIERMPTVKELRQLNFVKLEQQISDNGGFVAWAKHLNIPNKVKITRLTSTDIQDSIRQVMEELRITRMPTRSEILQSTGNYVLHNKIVRSGGYNEWSSKLGLEIKDSETKLGQSMEDVCLNFLIDRGYRPERMSTKYPFDILVNDNIRVDVKSGRAYDLRGSRCHTFGINKKYATCDLYVVFALPEDGNQIERTLIIPSNKLRVTTLSIGENSTYNTYLNRWDYFDTYDQFYKSII